MKKRLVAAVGFELTPNSPGKSHVCDLRGTKSGTPTTADAAFGELLALWGALTDDQRRAVLGLARRLVSTATGGRA